LIPLRLITGLIDPWFDRSLHPRHTPTGRTESR
jgi:hypothetical protein